MKKSEHHICFVAGKSGGHIIPALTLAERLCTENPNTRILFFSTDAILDQKIIGENKLIERHVRLPIGSSPVKPSNYLFIGYAFVKSFFKSFAVLRKNRPERVISMGGLVSIPVCLAARLWRIPVTLYELNAVPGRAVHFLAPYVREIRVCFDAARARIKTPRNVKIICDNYPVRFKQADKVSPDSARCALGIPPDARVLLILGGSQGSVFLNNFAEKLLKHILERDKGKSSPTARPIIVLHQAGEHDIDKLRHFYRKNRIEAHVCAYRENMALWYCATDFVVSRAGSGTLFESAFFGKKTLVIPLETRTTTHQVDNAYAMAARHSDLFTVVRRKSIPNNSSLYNSILMHF